MRKSPILPPGSLWAVVNEHRGYSDRGKSTAFYVSEKDDINKPIALVYFNRMETKEGYEAERAFCRRIARTVAKNPGVLLNQSTLASSECIRLMNCGRVNSKQFVPAEIFGLVCVPIEKESNWKPGDDICPAPFDRMIYRAMRKQYREFQASKARRVAIADARPAPAFAC